MDFPEKKTFAPPNPQTPEFFFFWGGGGKFPPPKTKSRETLSVTFSSLRSFWAFSRTSKSVKLGGIIGDGWRWEMGCEKKYLGEGGPWKIGNQTLHVLKSKVWIWHTSWFIKGAHCKNESFGRWSFLWWFDLLAQNVTSSEPNISNEFQWSISFGPLNCFPTICPIGVAPPKDPNQKNRQSAIFRLQRRFVSISGSTPQKITTNLFWVWKNLKFFFPLLRRSRYRGFSFLQLLREAWCTWQPLWWKKCDVKRKDLGKWKALFQLFILI